MRKTRKCSVCGKVKRIGLFVKRSEVPSGIRGRCLVCSRKIGAKLYHSNAGKEAYMSSHKRWYQKNVDKIREKGKIERDALKKEVLLHYGGKCVCCGQNFYKFLTLDHSDNDGNVHRAEKRRTGVSLYRWLRKIGYPNDPPLQVMCFNCNCAKGVYGKCPHDDGVAL